MGPASPQTEAERALRAVVALLAANRDDRAEQTPQGKLRRSELVLSEAGFSVQEIARFTGKNPEAVRSTIRRLTKSKAGA